MATKSSGHASSMAELMAKSSHQVKTIQKGDIVEGTVVRLTPAEILLDIDAKGQALVLEFDKKNVETLMKYLPVGDTVKASVISPESEQGFPVVSLRRTMDDLMYKDLEAVANTNEPFEAQVTEATRGGYFVTTESGVQGFLPNSQVATEEDLSGKTLELKIIEFDRAKKRVIFSQKAVNFVTDPAEIEKYVNVGDTVKAEVNSLVSYGMYVTITPKEGVCVEGFVHISEISHDRVENLGEMFKAGDTITAQVLGVDAENRRVNLSLKSLATDTFASIKEKYSIEQSVKGKVTDVKTRGITLDLGEDVRGFIPANKIPTGTSYEVGQTVDAEVTDFDMKRRVVLLTPVLKKTFVGYR
jgi:small subunit ribosomal protein S1